MIVFNGILESGYEEEYPPTMNHLFGTDFKYSDDKEKIIKEFEYKISSQFRYINWKENGDYTDTDTDDIYSISPDMLIENKDNIPNYNKPRQLVYENKI